MDNTVPEQLVTLLPRLRRFAYSLTGSLEDADDVVQSACERALARLDQFVPGSRLDSWMYRIIQTTWIDRLRHSGRRSELHAPDVVESLPFDARIQEQTEARDALAIVRAEVAKLPEEQRVVLALVTIDDRSYQEAADILRIPVGTVMSRLARARSKLAAAVGRFDSME
jgi:RNA polymerase sigma-70 factor (ECF subfamily)